MVSRKNKRNTKLRARGRQLAQMIREGKLSFGDATQQFGKSYDEDLSNDPAVFEQFQQFVAEQAADPNSRFQQLAQQLLNQGV